MKLDAEFIRLPLTFDAGRLAEEVAQFSEQDWRGHPQDVGGNFRLPLIAAGGDPNDDEVKGEMAPTPHLERCEYLRQVLASLDTVLGRTRLMRIDGNAEATMHVDDNYYWVDRVRVHVPIVTSPEIEFVCGENTVHMPAGEAWLFDTWRMHNALNPTGERRIHLVADTVGSEGFWRLVQGGERPFVEGGDPAPSEHVPYDPGASAEVETERTNFPVVMSPGEQERLAESLFDDLDPANDAEATRQPALRPAGVHAELGIRLGAQRDLRGRLPGLSRPPSGLRALAHRPRRRDPAHQRNRRRQDRGAVAGRTGAQP